MKIYNKSIDELFTEFQTSSHGLSQQDIQLRQKQNGYNKLEEEENEGAIKVFCKQFLDTLIIILLIAAGVSYFSGSKGGAIVIVVVLIINAILGTVQHIKARKSMDSLRKLSSPKTTVLRDGVKQAISSEEIVPGDICFVEAGDIIPADGRVLSSFSLLVNENSLTGESEAVEKTTATIKDYDLALGDQKNMVFSSSLVNYGRAEILITATGMNTEIGKIAKLLGETKSKTTPLQKAMDSFGKKLSLGIIVLCIMIFGLYIYHGNSLVDSLLLSVALAVAAIPEALSPIITIVLSLESKELFRENVIIKELKSVEALGSVSIICSDKTGTLTQNKMTVKEIFIDNNVKSAEEINSDNDAERLLLNALLLCSDATDTVGDPTEIALVDLAKKYHLSFKTTREKYERMDEIPFDSDRKLMSTLINYKDKNMVFTKGALDSLVSRIDEIMLADGSSRKLTSEDIKKITETNYYFAEKGLRVLCFAVKDYNKDRIFLEDENNYIFVGLVAMIDPPREESKQAVADCISAGIKPIMITGDHKITARAIAREIGIFNEEDNILEGVDLEKMSDEELLEIVKTVSVYARVSPEHKIRIVNAWQKLGYICAMTGDGVNDAPALKKADIGIAMGITGTEVSKNAASMILVDDNFSTIIKAVLSGRNIYRNIKNSISFLLSGNLSAIIAVIYTTVANLPIIFSPVQLLFINLITDSLPAIAIGVEPKSSQVLNEKPRDPNEGILTKNFLLTILSRGILLSIFVVSAFYIGLKTGDNLKASTMAFATLALARLFHTLNCRDELSIFKIGFFKNKQAVYSVLLGVILLVAVLFTPRLFPLFETTTISLKDLGIIFALSFAPTFIIQLVKVIREKDNK